MWYALPAPDGHFQRLGGDPELKRIPRGAIELTETQYQQLKADRKALWYRDGVVKAVDQAVVLAEAKTRMRREIAALRDRKIAAGFSHTFPDGIAGTVQMRNTRDVLIITGLGSAASVIAQRGGTDPLVFHDGENKEHHMKPSEVLDMALAAQVYYSACYAVSWARKAAGEALSRLDEVERFDPATGEVVAAPEQPVVVGPIV